MDNQNERGLVYDGSLTLRDVERTWVIWAMQHHKGNKAVAARALGITSKTLYNRLHEYGIFEEWSKYGKEAQNDAHPT